MFSHVFIYIVLEVWVEGSYCRICLGQERMHRDSFRQSKSTSEPILVRNAEFRGATGASDVLSRLALTIERIRMMKT